MNKFDKSQFRSKSEMLNFLVDNQEIIKAQKKAETKFTNDFVQMPQQVFIGKQNSNKEIKANEPIDTTGINAIKVLIVLNTTNLLDGHDDVHMPGLWDKSLQENKMLMHLQEHKMQFDKIISDKRDLKAFVQNIAWTELGQTFLGTTEALIFESNIKKDRNEFMFNQYAAGYVDNHSVGMRYVQLVLAVNDDNWGAEYEAWEKYFPEVANKEDALELSYFWVVKEAKLIEGSAVPLGSNWVTPTRDNNLKFVEPSLDTPISEPSLDTRKREYLLNLIKNS